MGQIESYDVAPYADLSPPDGSVRVAQTMALTTVHGPGNRFALWTQACRKRCPGCINGAMLDEDSGKKKSPEVLCHNIQASIGSVAEVEGITLMGGEPTLQARSLVPLLRSVRGDNPTFNVLLFSGYRAETLGQLSQTHLPLRELLDLTDTLIDGTFECDQLDPLRIAGSTNQRILHFTDRLVGRDFSRHGLEYAVRPSEMGVVQIRTGVDISKKSY